MAEITKDDLITPEALQVPLDLADNFEKVIQSIDDLIAVSKKAEDSIGGGTSIPKMKADTDQLGASLTELDKIQKQYTTSTQKLSDEYIGYKKALADVNQEVKTKTELGDKEATSVNKQTDSLKQLDAALQKNRTTYAQLQGDQERNSKAGQELLKVIQAQDTASKQLSATMGQSQKNVGNYVGALETISPTFQKAESATLSFGAAASAVFDALLVNPIFLALAGLVATYELLKSAVNAYFTETIEGQEKSNELSLTWQFHLEAAKETWRGIGEVVSDFFSMLLTRNEDAAKIAEIMTKSQKDQIKFTTENADLQLDKDRQLFIARDKLRNTDQERYDALKKSMEDGAKIRANELILVNDEIEAQKIKMSNMRSNFTELQKLADLEAKRKEIQDSEFANARRRQQLEIQIINDITKKTEENQKAEREAVLEKDKAVIQSSIDANATIIGNQQFSLDEQLGALAANLRSQQDLNNEERDAEIQKAKEAGRARIILDTGVAKAILDNTEISVAEKARRMIAAQDAEVEKNKAFQDTVTAINEKYATKNEQDTKKAADSVAKITDDSFKAIITARERFNQEDTAEQLKGLKLGQTALLKYEGDKAAILHQSAIQNLTIQSQEIGAEIKLLQDKSQTIVGLTASEAKLLADLQKKEAELEIQIDAEKNKVILQQEQNLRNARLKLQQEFFSATVTIGNNLFAEQIQQLQSKQNAEQAAKDKELSVANLTADQKAQIEKKYTAIAKQETDKLLQLRREQAVFDKEIAAFQIIIKTAEGVADAIANVATLPLVPFIIAEGALQEAAVLSRPIPAYELGTKSAKGGISRVGEGGTELVKSPSGKMFLTPPLPTLMNIAKGSQVFTNKETMKILALGSLNQELKLTGENNILQNEIRVWGQIIKDSNAEVVKAIDRSGKTLLRQGNLLYDVREDSKGNKKMVRIKTVGK